MNKFAFTSEAFLATCVEYILSNTFIFNEVRPGIMAFRHPLCVFTAVSDIGGGVCSGDTQSAGCDRRGLKYVRSQKSLLCFTNRNAIAIIWIIIPPIVY
jgi:hypothetical protein